MTNAQIASGCGASLTDTDGAHGAAGFKHLCTASTRIDRWLEIAVILVARPCVELCDLDADFTVTANIGWFAPKFTRRETDDWQLVLAQRR